MIGVFKILIRSGKKIQNLFKHLPLPDCQNLKKTTYNGSEIQKKTKKNIKSIGNNKCEMAGPCSINENSNAQKYLPKYSAIKVIRKYKLNYLQKANVFKEIRIMQDVDHPNIVRFLSFLENDDYYFLILELLEGGEIFHQIVRLTYLSEDLSRHIILQVAHAIRYLHEKKGIVHRDIKPENILFRPIPFIPSKSPKIRTGESTNKQDEGIFIKGIGAGGIGHVKIADFGLSKVIWDKQTMTPCGTISYTAPEILKDQKYSKCVDMWALGCVLYTLLCGFPPFYDENIQVLSRKVAQGEYSFLSPWWDEISKSSQDLISNLLRVDPRERYTIDQFLNHPWILESNKETQFTHDMSCISSTLTTDSTISLKSKLKTPFAFKGSRKDFGSLNIIPLRKAFDISYMVQRMKEENAFHMPMILNNNFENTEKINYFIKEALQKNMLSKAFKKDFYSEKKNSKNIYINHKEEYDTFTYPDYFSLTQSCTDHSLQKSHESQFELSLEKSSLLCRRKALIAVDI
ncbi:uncharacterized protein T551_02300 [Pneumocystis jirovecii RU7]|uniref:Protein kinase domain-containing protein n=1 Tax=Pneumocystis jirovecii (strain RU7) TaxID=1408657 RepID=A0A0W4ZKW6_PNEJ7|nr:uncharacterized protein T551_02300 [Pneumocystis jirovecii RU7]KTW29026.1 hypothetical protein T551_02300 [Pneumocystis jirovecii RU7]